MSSTFSRYNRCQESFPPDASISHAIVRCYIKANLTNRLVNLLSDRLTYGLLPNFYTLNLLMDTFIKEKNYAAASKIAYCSTIQEDFSNPVNALLALETVVQHLTSSNLEDLALKKPQPTEEEEEEVWVKVKYIQYPFYDDHFDIKDERFLIGKTLILLSLAPSLNLTHPMATSLNLIGNGLYHKFDKGISCLKSISQSSDDTISEEAINYFSESLKHVESRNADEPEVEIALRTKDDEIRRLLPSHEEKAGFLEEFGKIIEKLTSQGKVVSDYDIKNNVYDFVNSNLNTYETGDIETQLQVFEAWARERNTNRENQIYESRKSDRIEEMKKQLKELQEKEELLNYFDMEEQIRLKFLNDEEDSDPKLTITKLEA